MWPNGWVALMVVGLSEKAMVGVTVLGCCLGRQFLFLRLACMVCIPARLNKLDAKTCSCIVRLYMTPMTDEHLVYVRTKAVHCAGALSAVLVVSLQSQFS